MFIRPLLSLLFLSLAVISGSLHAASRQPNILLIIADDLGWSDTTLYGTTKLYETPNLERLARRGMTFKRAYAASPLCSPTRASILTGLNPARVGITAPVCHTKTVRLKPAVRKNAPPQAKALICDSVTRFSTNHFTLPKALKKKGYVTGHFGKWHLGPAPWSPLEHGFDVDVPHWPGPGPAGSFVAPWKFPDFKERRPGEHIEDRMGDEAVAFMERHKNTPFFLNYWQFSVHAPFNAKEEYIERHRRRIDPSDPQRSPTYAAMVQSLDDNIGKMLDALDRLGIADNTILIFYSDNGGNMYNEVDGTTPTSNAPLRGGKGNLWEGGVRVPAIFAWSGRIEAGSRSDAMIQSTDIFPTLMELLDLQRPKGAKFDGRSIVPALEGRPFDRGPIFTFFPHQVRVPDNLPPAVSAHLGDWKLVRQFHQGENGAHQYNLFNLREDIGETNDLALSQPGRVKRLDALIESFLQDTAAIVPLPNPDYNPQSQSQLKAGVAALRNCDLRSENGMLHVTGKGPDPHFSLTPDKPIPKGRLVYVMEFKTSVTSGAQFFWQEKGARPAFHRSRRIEFDPLAEGAFNTRRIEFEAKRPVVNFRFDPFAGRGKAVIRTARVEDANGNILHEWRF